MTKIHLALFIAFLIIVASIRVLTHKPPTLPKNQPLKFEATVKREPRVYDTYQVIYIADSKIYADLYPRYRVGDRVEAKGQFDTKGRGFDVKIKKIGYRSNLSSFRSDLREKISQKIGELLPSREATLVVGTVLGIDTISQEFRDELTRTGTIHVVVVSGQNLMIVAGIFLSLARYVGRRKSLILAILAVFLYAFLTGFEPPVVRASIMVLATTAAVFLGREANTIFSLILAALIIILIWPQAVFEISFQLTFAATLGIVTLGQKIIKISEMRTSGIRYSFLQIAAISTSAYLFTAPVIFFYFSRVSLIAPIANILVAEAVFPIMVLGFLIATATFFFMPLAQLLAYFAFVPAFYFSEIVRVFAKIPIG